MTCWICSGYCLAQVFTGRNFDSTCIVSCHSNGMSLFMFNLLRWQLALTNLMCYHVNVFMFNLLKFQLAWPIFLGYHVNNTFDWLFLCTIELWLGKGDFAWISIRWGGQPNVVEHFIESSKDTYACCVYVSMRVELDASSNKFLMPCDFLNLEEKWNTVQLSSSCHCHCSLPSSSNCPLPHFSHAWLNKT